MYRFFQHVGRYRLFIQVVVATISFGLGFWGWTLKINPVGFEGWFNNFFRTLQLITLNFPTSLDQALPWQLEVARLALPIIAVVASFQTIVGSIRNPIRFAMLPLLRDHILVCGNETLGESALKHISVYRKRLFIVDKEISEAKQHKFDALGISAAKSDPRDPYVFRELNLKQAKALFLISADRMQNLNLVAIALADIKDRPHGMPPLIIAAQIDRDELGTEMVAGLDGMARSEGIRFRLLDTFREAVKIDLYRLMPGRRKCDSDQPSHALVIGLGENWKGILMQLIIALQDAPEVPPDITLVLDETEANAFDRFREDRPNLALIANCKVIEARRLRLFDEAFQAACAERATPVVALIMRSDSEALMGALQLRRPEFQIGSDAYPILLNLSLEDHLVDRLGEMDVRYRDLTRIYPVGGIIRPEMLDRILDGNYEELAAALHRHYASGVGAGGGSDTPWEALPENIRDANRASADHAPVLLGAVGLRVVRAVEGLKPPTLTDGEMDRLARIEHRRWCADRIDHGWRFGPVRNDALRHHPSLAPFDSLTAADQEKDYSAVRAILGGLPLAARAAVRERFAFVEIDLPGGGAAPGKRVAATLRDRQRDSSWVGLVIVLRLQTAEDAPILLDAIEDTAFPVWLIHEISLGDALSDGDEPSRRATRKLIQRAEIARRPSRDDFGASWEKFAIEGNHVTS
jgi:hypothetical protein